MTGNEYVNLALKRFLSSNRIDANFFQYLKNHIEEIAAGIFPTAGLFTYPVTITQNGAAGTFNLSPTTVEGIDNAGHILQLTIDYLTDIDYENTTGEYYWIGMKYIEIPSDVYANPRTGIPEYDKWKEAVGESSTPTSVTDNGNGTITLNVNSIFQSGIDHRGRPVMVWLVNPMSIDESVAIETRVSAYSAPNNTITTTGDLGQGTISTNVADYRVALIGVTVENTGFVGTNPFGDEYIDIGYIIGGNPGSKSDQGHQLDLDGGGGHTLQRAYDGTAGNGAGRTVTADDQAIQLVQENDTLREKDILQAALRIDKSTDKGTLVAYDPKEFEVGIDLKGRIRSNGMVLTRVNLIDLSGNDYLRAEESDVEVTVAGVVLTFNRSGVNLMMGSEYGKLLQAIDMCEIAGSVQGNDGLYYVNAVSIGSVQLYDLDFTAASLAQEVGNSNLRASFYRPITRVCGGYGINSLLIHGIDDWTRDASLDSSPIEVIQAPNADPANTMQRWSIYGGNALRITNNLDIVRASGNLDISPGVDSNEFVGGTRDAFQFAAQQTFYRRLNAWAGESGSSYWTRTNLAPNFRNSWIGTGAGVLYFHFDIPEGCELKSAAILYNDGGDAMSCGLNRYDDVWSITPDAPAPTLIDGPDSSAGVSGIRVLTLTPTVQEIADADSHYAVYITGHATGTSYIYAVRIAIGVTEIAFG